MNFASVLDEFHHWYGMLAVDMRLGVAQRHLNATARLCLHLLEKLREDPKLDVKTFRVLSFQLLDLQRQMQPKKPGPKTDERGPRLRLVGG